MTNDPVSAAEPKESSIPKTACWKLVVFSALVCTVSGLLALLLGSLSATVYSELVGEHLSKAGQHGGINLVEAGMIFGGGSGLLAGVLWCGIMIFRVLPKPAPRRIIVRGVLWGLVVSVLSTCILHLGLKMMVPPEAPSALLPGLMFGIPGGLFMGLICGVILKWVAPRWVEVVHTREE